MPIILVVDDSETDRKLMEGLLGADLDWLISHASNGEEAMEMISIAPPHVVVTDLVMPKMDGMELVAKVSESYPRVPVVLVTGQDDATLACRALRNGAASYVPKSQVSDRLLDTVEQVLSMAESDHHDDRIVQMTTNTRFRFTLENDPVLIAPLIDRVQQGMIAMQLCTPTKMMHVGIALEEAMINAMYHGNLELPVHQLAEVRKLVHEGLPSELLDERRQESPYGSRKLQVAADFTRERAQFVIADGGPGFDWKQQLANATEANWRDDRGRGLMLINTFMDEVAYNDAGNELRMILKGLR